MGTKYSNTLENLVPIVTVHNARSETYYVLCNECEKKKVSFKAFSTLLLKSFSYKHCQTKRECIYGSLTLARANRIILVAHRPVTFDIFNLTTLQ